MTSAVDVRKNSSSSVAKSLPPLGMSSFWLLVQETHHFSDGRQIFFASYAISSLGACEVGREPASWKLIITDRELWNRPVWSSNRSEMQLA